MIEIKLKFQELPGFQYPLEELQLPIRPGLMMIIHFPEKPTSIEETNRATKPNPNTPTHNSITIDFPDLKSRIYPNLFILQFYVDPSKIVTSQANNFICTASQNDFPKINWSYTGNNPSGAANNPIILSINGTLIETITFFDTFVFYRNYLSKVDIKNAGAVEWIFDQNYAHEFLKETETIQKL